MNMSDEDLSALALSLQVALFGLAGSLLPGFAIAWLLARVRFPGKAIVDAIVHLPLVLPPVVVGYLLLLSLGRRSPVGHWFHDSFGTDIAFTWKAAAIAAAVMGFPLLVRAMRLSLELVDPKLEDAARTLGASPFSVLLRVTLPLAWPGVLAGMTLSFARSLGEFGATITFAGNIAGKTRTIPTAIYAATQSPGGDASAMRLLVLSIGVSLAALLASEWLARRAARRLSSHTFAEGR